MQKKEIGMTNDVGFEVGVRKTLNSYVEYVWKSITSKEGIRIWLGEIKSGNFDLDQIFKTKDGIEGKLTVFKPFSHVRLSWKKPGWNNISTLQLRTIKAKNGVTLSFHQEKLLDGGQREAMKTHWNGVLNKLIEFIETNPISE
jgi:uncharacterized protein YndB with AHSA1/START domain